MEKIDDLKAVLLHITRVLELQELIFNRQQPGHSMTGTGGKPTPEETDEQISAEYKKLNEKIRGLK